MDLFRSSVKEEGSCNFCKRGILIEDQKRLQFPYDDVIVLAGTQAKVNFCDDCFLKLKNSKTP